MTTFQALAALLVIAVAVSPALPTVALIVHARTGRTERLLAAALLAFPGWWFWGGVCAGHAIEGSIPRALIWLPLAAGIGVTSFCCRHARRSVLEILIMLFVLALFYHLLIDGLRMENPGRL